MMTPNVTPSIVFMLASPTMFWSVVVAAGPVTYALTPGGAWSAVDDVADGLHRLVGQRLALVAGDVDLHVGGLAVDALGAGRGQGVTPEVLDVLYVGGVGASSRTTSS